MSPLSRENDRRVVQASSDPEAIRKSAAKQEPVLRTMVHGIAAQVPGAEVEGSRVKEADSQANKSDRGKPAETNIDNLGARISVATPEAQEKVIQGIKKSLPVVDQDKLDSNGLEGDQFAVKTGKPGDANQVSEIQVVSKPQAVAMKETEPLYEEQKQALASGDQERAEELGKKIEEQHQAAQETFGKEPAKYEYGSTQHNLSPDSEAHKGIVATQGQVADEDLAGDGKDVDQPHVTIRYGVQGDDTQGLKDFLSKQSPFDAKLGKTEMFPPTKNSDGAAVIQAPVESQDLHRLNGEIAKHGDFKESDFPDYKPHVTVAYVKPEAAEKYVGMDSTEGKSFHVDSVAISDRNGNKEEVPLKGASNSEMRGGRGESPEQPGQGAASTAPAGPTSKPQAWSRGTPVLVEGQFGGHFKQGTIAHFNSLGNGMPRRARVTLDDGGKLDSVREETLYRLKLPEEPSSETGTEAEGLMLKYLTEHAGKLVVAYLKANTDGGVVTFALDAAKNLFPSYRSDPTGNNAAVESSARAVMTAARSTYLSHAPAKGKDVVEIATGSPASGKTSGFAPDVAKNVSVRQESIFHDAAQAEQEIQEYLDAGYRPVVNLFFTDDPKIGVDRMVARANKIKRPVDINFMARAYVGVAKLVAELKAKFGDSIAVNSFDNSGEPKDLKAYRSTVAPAVKVAGQWNEHNVRERMHGRLNKLQREGKVAPELYQAAGGQSAH